MPEAERTKKQNIVCNQCGKVLKGKRQLQKHVKVMHNRVYSHFCDKCDYKTHVKMNLMMHVKRVHEGKPLKEQCPYCDSVTGSMDFHIKTYHYEKWLNSQ